MRSNKILFFMPYYKHGGAEVQFRRLLEYMVNREYNIKLYVLGELSGEEKSDINIPSRSMGVNLLSYQKKQLRHFAYFFTYVITTIKLLFFIFKDKPKIVITYSMPISPFILLFKLFKIKVIYSERTATDFLEKHSYLRYFYDKADYLVVNTPLTKEKFVKLGVEESKIKVIHNGLHLTQNVIFKAPKKISKIVLIGRIHPTKNQKYILNSIINSNLTVTFIGELVDHDYSSEINEIIDKHDLSSRVTFVPYTNDIESYYKNADLVVLPSLEEGTSNVILECFNIGKLVFASDIDANKYLLRDTQFYLDLNDYESLTRNISDYEGLEDSEKEKLLKENYEFLRSKFSMEKCYNNYSNLLGDDNL